MRPIEHYLRREGDQLSCHKCGKAWEIKDLDPPPCITKRDSDLKHVDELREILDHEKH